MGFEKKEAQFYKRLNDNKVICYLCPHNCTISSGKRGICRVRKNEEGTLITLNYGKITAYHLDPIEKKPLYHFYPGSYIFSIGSFGCNLRCSFCQNYSIAHGTPNYVEISPYKIAEITCEDEKNVGIAFTYNEPSIWYEYVYDTAEIVREKGKKNVLVTNGYISREPLLKVLPLIDAMNIDLKSFSQEFYSEICQGRITHVLETIKTATQYCHVEITTLLVEELNTSIEEIERLSMWIASIDKNIPLHLSRYYPNYKMALPATSVDKLKEAKKIANRHLNYVYIGNVMGVDNNTYCPKCRALLIRRGINTKIYNYDDNKCLKCGYEIGIIR